MDNVEEKSSKFKLGQTVLLEGSTEEEYYLIEFLARTAGGYEKWQTNKGVVLLSPTFDKIVESPFSQLLDLTDNPNWKALERAASRAIPGDEGVIAKCMLDVREYLNSIVKYLESKE